MKKLLHLSFLLLISFSFASCGNRTTASKLIGTWKVIHSTGYYKDSVSPDNNKEWDHDITENITITFHKNGTITINDDGETGSGTWKVDNNQVSALVGKKNSLTNILELTKSRLVMDDLQKHGTTEFYSKDVYIKVENSL